MNKATRLVLGAAVLGVLLVAGFSSNAIARVVGGLYGDRLHIEKEPRSAVPDVTVGDDDAYIAGTLEVDGDTRFDGSLTKTMPSTETIASAATITANACGGAKLITSDSAVTTGTTNTFTAPAAGNAGCLMDVVNVGPHAITLDINANFHSAGGANVVLGSSDTVRVLSTGSQGYWIQIGATGNN